MMSSRDVSSNAGFSKDLVADQTYIGVTKKLNTGMGFDAVKGLGIDGVTSSVAIQANQGGFADCRVEAVMIWGNAQGSTPSMQVCARGTTWDTPTGDQDWYCARIQTGNARLSKVVAGSYTNIASGAFSWTAGDSIKMVLACVGTELTATFENLTAAPGTVVTLVGTDSDITEGGIIVSPHVHIEWAPVSSSTYDNDESKNPLAAGILPRVDVSNNVSATITSEQDPDSVDSHKLVVTVTRADQDFDAVEFSLTGNTNTRTINWDTRSGLNPDNDIPVHNGVYIVASAFNSASASYVVAIYFNKSVVGSTVVSAYVKDTKGTTLWSSP